MGRSSLWLNARADGAAPSFADIARWAKVYRASAPFVVDENAQISYRYGLNSSSERGQLEAGKTPYAIIISPAAGKGNVTAYSKSGLVMVNCCDQAQPWFHQMIEAWTHKR